MENLQDRGRSVMRTVIGVAIAIWLSQPAQAETPIYEFIDVGSTAAGGAQIYSAFLLDYRENKFYVCSASYKTGAPPTARKRDCKRIKCAKRRPYGLHAQCCAARPLASRPAAGNRAILHRQSHDLRERDTAVSAAEPFVAPE